MNGTGADLPAAPAAARDAVADALTEFARLTAIFGTTDRRNGTNAHDFSQRATQAAGAVVRAREKGKLTWRHVLAEQYWAVLAEPDRATLRRRLVGLAAHALLWAAALDRRTADPARQQPRPRPRRTADYAYAERLRHFLAVEQAEGATEDTPLFDGIDLTHGDLREALREIDDQRAQLAGVTETLRNTNAHRNELVKLLTECAQATPDQYWRDVAAAHAPALGDAQ